MQKMCVLVVLIVGMLVHVGVAQTNEADIFKQSVTIKFMDAKLQEILGVLSKKTGIQVVYAANVSKKTVSGEYSDMQFITVIRRLFSGESYALQMDAKKRTLFVKSFGEARYVTTKNGNMTDLGISIGELRSLHEEQSKEYLENQNDESEFFEDVKMTRGELRDLHEKQSVQYEQERNNPTQYLTEVAMTREQLQAMHEEQVEEFNSKLSDKETELPEIGMTLGDHQAMLETQENMFEKQQMNKDEYISELGMTRAVHQQLLFEQMEKFKQSLTD